MCPHHWVHIGGSTSVGPRRWVHIGGSTSVGPHRWVHIGGSTSVGPHWWVHISVCVLCAGYIWAEDKEHCEEYGRMLQADPSRVSTRAKKRGLPQASPRSTTTNVRCFDRGK